jgi:hypothetical protein
MVSVPAEIPQVEACESNGNSASDDERHRQKGEHDLGEDLGLRALGQQ